MNLPNLKQLKSDIINNYDEILKLPKNRKEQMIKKLYIIQEIERKDYRREVLSNAGFEKEAQQEEHNINQLTKTLNMSSENMSSDTVLKGGISNTRYIWHTGSNACEECQALDGSEYNYEGDIPDKPHPNCQCYIEVIEDENDDDTESDNHGNGKGGNKNDEPCDCWNEIAVILDEADELEGDVLSEIDELNSIENDVETYFADFQSLFNEVQNAVIELEQTEPCGDNCIVITGFATNIQNDMELEDKVYNIIKNIDEAKEVYEIFIEHKHEMSNTAGSFDKYYHAKANCEAAELGAIQSLWAVLFSIAKEIKDFKYKVFDDHQDFKKVFVDCMQDLRADLYGLMKAREHGYCSDKVKDVGDIFK